MIQRKKTKLQASPVMQEAVSCETKQKIYQNYGSY
jgi:hypothetical protein